MSRGPGSHQRVILDALGVRGWVWLRALPYRTSADRTSYWRAARALQAAGRLRIEKRTRHWHLAPWTLLVSVTRFPRGTALPIDEPYWPEKSSEPEHFSGKALQQEGTSPLLPERVTGKV